MRCSKHEGLTPAYAVNGTSVTGDRGADGYRLPTEAEWEYPCRAGTMTAFHNGPIIDVGCDGPNLDAIGWYCGNASSKTQEVAQEFRSARGLYDMSGNVFEWCWDWFEAYPTGPVTDPVGGASGTFRVTRGGSWYEEALCCRSAWRRGYVPFFRVHILGLRPARTAP